MRVQIKNGRLRAEKAGRWITMIRRSEVERYRAESLGRFQGARRTPP